MKVTLPLDDMTTEEKLQIMEALWVDLTRSEQEFQSPVWHKDVLKAREERIKSGQETYQNWELAKKALRDKLL